MNQRRNQKRREYTEEKQKWEYTYRNVWNATKVILRGKSIAINT